jgi:hypothetical protein
MAGRKQDSPVAAKAEQPASLDRNAFYLCIICTFYKLVGNENGA